MLQEIIIVQLKLDITNNESLIITLIYTTPLYQILQLIQVLSVLHTAIIWNNLLNVQNLGLIDLLTGISCNNG